MKNFYVNVEPGRYSGFFKIFDLVDEDGDIVYIVKRYDGKSPIELQDLADGMSLANYHIFGFSIHVPELVKKMNMQVMMYEEDYYVVFKLAPFLGLPGDNFKEELKELKDLLEWQKEKAISNPLYNVRLGFDRVDKDVKFEIISTSQALQEKLTEELNEKIAQSPILQKWIENQKEGYKHVATHCFDLWSYLDAFDLMSLKESEAVVNQRPEQNIVERTKKLKRRR